MPYLEKLGFHSSATAARRASATRARCRRRSRRRSSGATWSSRRCCRATATSRAAIHPEVRANYLDVAAARRRLRARRPRRHRPLDASRSAPDRDGKPVFLQDVWPSPREIADAIARAIRPRDVPSTRTPTCSTATSAGARSRCPPATAFAWDAGLDLHPPADRTSTASRRRRPPMTERSSARACSPCSATASPPITSRPPAASEATSPAGQYLVAHGVEPRTSTPTARGAATTR